MSGVPTGRAAARALISRQLRRLRRVVIPSLQAPDRLSENDREPAIDALYRLILGRPIDDGGRQHYRRLIREEGVTLRDIAVELAASDDFQDRLQRRVERRPFDPPTTRPDGFVDVQALLATRSLSELAEAAEQYYARTREAADTHHAKPLANIFDAPYLLGAFGQLLAGLRLAPGMTVLDFAAGTGWITRSLAQLGCETVATDVSATALDLARGLFERVPPVGPWSPPRFVVFDGHRLDCANASVDRIVCFDALHHVPNPAEVLAEMGRVLRPGGIAGFSEPGPTHSHGAQSQFEMKNSMVVENDIVLSDIRAWSEAAGFTRMEVGIFNTESHLLTLEGFDDLMAGGAELDDYGDRLRAYLLGHQMFFLHKGSREPDSRERTALNTRLIVELGATRWGAHEQGRGRATVTNIGTGRWLSSATTVGGVSLGVHLRRGDGEPVDLEFARFPLHAETGPGATQVVEFVLPLLPPGEHIVEFDLVSEGVAWFETNRSATVVLPIVVTPH